MTFSFMCAVEGSGAPNEGSALLGGVYKKNSATSIMKYFSW